MAFRVGYVSADFGDNHPVTHLMRGVWRPHAAVRKTATHTAKGGNHNGCGGFAVFRYHIGGDRPRPTATAQHANDGGTDITDRDLTGLDDVSAARLVAADRLHALVDLNGFTNGGRPEIFALRPAALQLGYLGWPATSGSERAYDWQLMDTVLAPPDAPARLE